MKKKNQLLSAIALSVGLSLSASVPVFAAIPSQVPGQAAIPSLAPMLEKVLPAVVSVQVEGTAVQSQRVPEELKKNILAMSLRTSRRSLLKAWLWRHY